MGRFAYPEITVDSSRDAEDGLKGGPFTLFSGSVKRRDLTPSL